MQHLIAIDSDGTLKHSDGIISEETKKIIKKIVSKNHYVVICTARPRYHTLKVSTEVGASDFLISSNGSEIYDKRRDKLIWATFMDIEKCKKIYNYAKKNNLRIMFITDNTEYVTQFTRNDNQVLLNDINLNVVLNENIKQVMIIGKEKDSILKFKDIVQNRYKMNVIDSSNMNKEEIWFSVVSDDASKGNALLNLAKYLKIPRKQLIAIGNDKNDISMIKKANLGIAVENAENEVKQVADIIIDSNDNDGVAKFLETLKI